MAHPSHRSSSTMDSEPLEDFEGAAGVTNLGNQTENLSHTCDLCQSKSPFASCFAYLHKGTFDFRKNTDEALDRAGFEFRREEWTQRGGGAVAYAGIECCEKHHNETYQQDNGKPTSAWYHHAKKRRGGGATTRSSGRWTRGKEGRRGAVLTDASSSGAIEAPPSGWVQRYAHRQSLGLGDQTLPGGLHALRLCKMPHLPLGEQQVVAILLDRKRERQNIHKRWPVAMHELSPQMDLGGRWNSAHARGRLPRG